jgi:hypothetical protein
LRADSSIVNANQQQSDLIGRDKFRDPRLKEIDRAVISAPASITQEQAGGKRCSQ